MRPAKDQGTVKVKDQEHQREASQLCPVGEGDQPTPGSGEPPAPAPLPLATWGPRHIPQDVAHQLTSTHPQAPQSPPGHLPACPLPLVEAWPVKRAGEVWAGAAGLNPCAHRGTGVPCYLLPVANTHSPAFHQDNTGCTDGDQPGLMQKVPLCTRHLITSRASQLIERRPST